MRFARGSPIRISVSLSAAARVRRALPAARSARGRRIPRLATTIDDAAGEAFDKAAKLLGLDTRAAPHRGVAKQGDPNAVPLPRPLVGSGEPHFSFAGLKSAVQRAAASGEFGAKISQRASSRRSSTASRRTRVALEGAHAPALVVAGGVAANQAIRTALDDLAK